MRLQNAPLLAATATVLLLSACGGGGPSNLGPGRTVVPSASDVFALTNTTADATSRIGGAALASETNTVQISTAQLPHQTGNLLNFSISNSAISIADLNETPTGGWSDGNDNTLTISPAQQGNYLYAGIFNFTSLENPESSGPIIIGTLTPSLGLPSRGSASYSGEAFVDGTTAGSAIPFTARGVSTITASFGGAPTVGVVIDALQNSPPFDQIKISGMGLSPSASTFEGGTVSLFLDGNPVTDSVLGAGYSSDASGAFYGLDSTVEDFQPDEVGGIFVGDGTEGTLSGGFLAD